MGLAYIQSIVFHAQVEQSLFENHNLQGAESALNSNFKIDYTNEIIDVEANQKYL